SSDYWFRLERRTAWNQAAAGNPPTRSTSSREKSAWAPPAWYWQGCCAGSSGAECLMSRLPVTAKKLVLLLNALAGALRYEEAAEPATWQQRASAQRKRPALSSRDANHSPETAKQNRRTSYPPEIGKLISKDTV